MHLLHLLQFPRPHLRPLRNNHLLLLQRNKQHQQLLHRALQHTIRHRVQRGPIPPSLSDEHEEDLSLLDHSGVDLLDGAPACGSADGVGDVRGVVAECVDRVLGEERVVWDAEVVDDTRLSVVVVFDRDGNPVEELAGAVVLVCTIFQQPVMKVISMRLRNVFREPWDGTYAIFRLYSPLSLLSLSSFILTSSSSTFSFSLSCTGAGFSTTGNGNDPLLFPSLTGDASIGARLTIPTLTLPCDRNLCACGLVILIGLPSSLSEFSRDRTTRMLAPVPESGMSIRVCFGMRC